MDINCLGNDFVTGCGQYNGPGLPNSGVSTGDDLNTVLSKLDNNNQNLSGPDNLSSDDIVSNANVRSHASPCQAQVVNRNFTYSITSSGSGLLIGWDMSVFASALPSNYSVTLPRTRITSIQSTRSVLIDSQDLIGAVPASIGQFPLRVSIEVQITTPCGTLAAVYMTDLYNASNLGAKAGTFDIEDLNPNTGNISVTDHLNILEDEIFKAKTKEVSRVEISGTSLPIATAVQSNAMRVDDLERSLVDIGGLLVSYTNGNVTGSEALATVLNKLITRISKLEDTVLSLQTRISDLENA